MGLKQLHLLLPTIFSIALTSAPTYAADIKDIKGNATLIRELMHAEFQKGRTTVCTGTSRGGDYKFRGERKDNSIYGPIDTPGPFPISTYNITVATWNGEDQITDIARGSNVLGEADMHNGAFLQNNTNHWSKVQKKYQKIIEIFSSGDIQCFTKN